jgi:probable HAF family extracellular repeat protein
MKKNLSISAILFGSLVLSAPAHALSYNFTNVIHPNAPNIWAFGINNSGNVVGYYTDSTNSIAHGFIYNGSTFTDLNDPNGVNSTYAQSINNSGVVVGYYIDSNFNRIGFIYNGSTFTDVIPPNAVYDTYAFGINDSGVVVGSYFDSNNIGHGFI